MMITIGFGADIPKTERAGKGNSIISFPKDYVVVDIETTGLSPEWDDIMIFTEGSDRHIVRRYCVYEIWD